MSGLGDARSLYMVTDFPLADSDENCHQFVLLLILPPKIQELDYGDEGMSSVYPRQSKISNN
jgi:hypothetical protein